VSAAHVFNQLVLSVVFYRADATCIGLFLSMAALVILAVANGGEALLTVLALVRLLACVGSHMHQQVALLRKDFTAVGLHALKQVLPRVRRLNMEFEAGSPGEGFLAV